MKLSIKTTRKRPKGWKEDQVGEILIEEIPYVSEGNKYEFFVILNKELPAELLEDPDADVFDYLYNEDIEIWKVELLEEKQLPKNDRKFLWAVKEVDTEIYQKKFVGKPIYCLYLTVDDDFEGYSSPWGYVSKNEVAADTFRSWLEKEDYDVILHSARKIKKFPWERKRITGRVPITEKMFEKMISKTKKEGEQQ